MRTIVLVLLLTLVAGGVGSAGAEEPPHRLRVTPAALASVSLAAGTATQPIGPTAQAGPAAQSQPAARRSWIQRHRKWLVPVLVGTAVAGVALLTRRDKSTGLTPAPGG